MVYTDRQTACSLYHKTKKASNEKKVNNKSDTFHDNFSPIKSYLSLIATEPHVSRSQLLPVALTKLSELIV